MRFLQYLELTYNKLHVSLLSEQHIFVIKLLFQAVNAEIIGDF
jgi:hypothetical protein